MLKSFNIDHLCYPWNCIREVNSTAVLSSNGLICAHPHSRSGFPYERYTEKRRHSCHSVYSTGLGSHYFQICNMHLTKPTVCIHNRSRFDLHFSFPRVSFSATAMTATN